MHDEPHFDVQEWTVQKMIRLLLAAVLLAGCATSATPSPMVQVSPPWVAAERAEYTILVAGQAQGSIIFTVMPKEDGFLIGTEATMGSVKTMTQTRVDKTLQPIGDTSQLTGAGKADYTLMKVYDRGKLSFQARTADGDKAVTISYPADTWDNDQLLMSVRSLPLAEGYSVSVTIFAGTTAPIKTTIKVVGKEEVTVPAGTYTAYKVEFDFGQSKHSAWYDVNRPYHMVKYERPEGPQAMVLTKVGTP